MTNKELQEKLKQFPDDAEIITSEVLEGQGYCCVDSYTYVDEEDIEIKLGEFDDGWGKKLKGLLINLNE